MKEIGGKLRTAREAKNISLEEVQAQTKIRLRYLEAIESGDWDIIPGEVYRRGFVCSYASMVGLDGEELLREYHQAQKPRIAETAVKSQPVGEEVEIQVGRTADLVPKTASPKQLKVNWFRLLVSSGVCLGVILGAGYFLTGGFFKNKPAVTTVKSETTSNRNLASQRQKGKIKRAVPLKKPQPGATFTVQQLYPAPLTVYAEFSEKAWVQVTTDGQVKYLDGGATFSEKSPKQLWTANREMVIRVGNAGGLKLNLNGKDVGVVGEPGQPRTVTITGNGVEIK